MAAETGFTIDGKLYEVPDLSTFTLDEAQVLYDYSGLTIEDFVAADEDDEDDRAARLKNPGFMRALIHIAYQRGNTKIPAARVKALVGAANLISTLETLGTDEAEQSPPELTSEPDVPSLNGTLENENSNAPSNLSSGSGSENGSGRQAEIRPLTGVSRSAISSIEPNEISAA